MALQQTASSFVNFNDWICPTENCPAVIGNVLVYRDDKHVSKLFADSMLPVVRARLVPHLAAAANTRQALHHMRSAPLTTTVNGAECRPQ